MSNNDPEGGQALSYLVYVPPKSLAHHKMGASRKRPLRELKDRSEEDCAKVGFSISEEALERGP